MFIFFQIRICDLCASLYYYYYDVSMFLKISCDINAYSMVCTLVLWAVSCTSSSEPPRRSRLVRRPWCLL